MTGQIIAMSEPDLVTWCGIDINGNHLKSTIAIEDAKKNIEYYNWVPFCAAIVSRKCLSKTGLLNEDFVFLHSDIEFCERARAGGFSCVYNPMAHVYHKWGGSIDTNNVHLVAILRADNIKFRKNFS